MCVSLVYVYYFFMGTPGEFVQEKTISCVNCQAAFGVRQM